MKNLKIFAITLSLLLFMASCNWFSSNSNCTRLMDRRSMANMLTDVFLLEAILSSQTPESGLRDSIEIFYAGIFQKYGVTEQEFQKAFDCYLLDQQNMTWVMDEVLSALSIARSKIDEKKDD